MPTSTATNPAVELDIAAQRLGTAISTIEDLLAAANLYDSDVHTVRGVLELLADGHDRARRAAAEIRDNGYGD